MKKTFDIIKDRAVAAEELTSAYCNMGCEYCYIPKTSSLKQMHGEVVEFLKKPQLYIDMLKEMYGDNLEYLSYWGTEPTLILQYVTPTLPDYLAAFPRLCEFGFSTNFMSHSDRVLDFIKGLNTAAGALHNFNDPRLVSVSDEERRKQEKPFGKDDRRLHVKLQISLDGPEEITDKTRQAGATKKIVDNFVAFVDAIAGMDLKFVKVTTNFKPTLSMDVMKSMATDADKFDNYFKFFNDLYDVYAKRHKEIHEKMNLHLSGSGTLMVPGKYTSEDGKMFAIYIRRLNEFYEYLGKSPRYDHYQRPMSEYSVRFDNFMTGQLESPKAHQTCSGGDTNYAIDTGGNIHICHRSFYMNDQRYLDAIKEEKDIENWDVSLFEDGKINNAVKNYIVHKDDEFEVARFLTVMRGFHDFSKFRESQINAMVFWLAKARQADHRFLVDDEYRDLFSKYIVYVFGCSIENILNTTSVHITPISMIRIFANGAFDIILEEYLRLHPNVKIGGKNV